MATQLKAPEAEAEIIPPVDGGDNDDASPERDLAEEARAHGWLPKEEFKGDAARWVDEETFMKRADEVMPLLKKQNEKLKRDFDELRKQARKASDFFSKAEERAYERARTELRQEQEDAARSGDMAAHKAAGDKLDALEAPSKPAATAAEAEAAFDAWCDKNPWYDRADLSSATDLEKDARVYADKMTQRHLAKTKDMPPDEFFAMIGGLVADKFPALNNRAPRAKPVSDVAPATNRGNQQRGKSWSDIADPEERRIAERLATKWAESGLLKHKDDYLKSYDWSKQ